MLERGRIVDGELPSLADGKPRGKMINDIRSGVRPIISDATKDQKRETERERKRWRRKENF